MEGELKVYFYDTEAGARQIEATVIPARAAPHVRTRLALHAFFKDYSCAVPHLRKCASYWHAWEACVVSVAATWGQMHCVCTCMRVHPHASVLCCRFNKSGSVASMNMAGGSCCNRGSAAGARRGAHDARRFPGGGLSFGVTSTGSRFM